jgi:hypothetical protein
MVWFFFMLGYDGPKAVFSAGDDIVNTHLRFEDDIFGEIRQENSPFPTTFCKFHLEPHP